jgi:hypothetical protein
MSNILDIKSMNLELNNAAFFKKGKIHGNPESIVNLKFYEDIPPIPFNFTDVFIDTTKDLVAIETVPVPNLKALIKGAYYIVYFIDDCQGIAGGMLARYDRFGGNHGHEGGDEYLFYIDHNFDSDHLCIIFPGNIHTYVAGECEVRVIKRTLLSRLKSTVTQLFNKKD